MENMDYKILLASKSPRRRELLKKLIDDFEVTSVDVDEKVVGTTPREIVENLSRKKAEAVNFDGIVITSDTLVFDGNIPLGKPVDKNDAFKMLKELNNKSHIVASGVCLKSPVETILFSDVSTVCFKCMTDEEIWYYINHFNPLDKAGAYGVQDGFCVDKVIGSYSNVMGLPLEALSDKLKKFGLKVKEF